VTILPKKLFKIEKEDWTIFIRAHLIWSYIPNCGSAKLGPVYTWRTLTGVELNNNW